jgi:hypothetical protein
MLYILFDTEQEAKDYSHAEAIARGHGLAEHTIQYWLAWRETIDGRWAVQCPDGSEEEPIWKPLEVEDDN